MTLADEINKLLGFSEKSQVVLIPIIAGFAIMAILLLPIILFLLLVLGYFIYRFPNTRRNEIIFLFRRAAFNAAGNREDRLSMKLATVVEPFCWFICNILARVLGIIDCIIGCEVIRFPPPRIAQITDYFSVVTYLVDKKVKECIEKEYQLVILFAGYDVRCFTIANNNNNNNKKSTSKLFEVDRADLQIKKIKCLEEAKISREGVTMISADITKDDWIKQLEVNGYNNDIPTIFILEGTCIISHTSIHNIFKTISLSCKGSSLVFDYLSFYFLNDTRFGCLAKKMIQRISGQKILYGMPGVAGSKDAGPMGCRDSDVTSFLDLFGMDLVDNYKVGVIGGVCVASVKS
eukprot:GHVR01156367.1.p1 GENE.GHVR01156367.1~~GHVR01156367.1.p1  ORF type:complete len:359 (+),score=85.32 GHVR01156367.1:35-1078(+)